MIDFRLATVNLPINATWAVNATTVVGLANGTVGSSNSSLNSPAGITISTDDILYVADDNNNRVVVVNLTSSAVIRIIGSYGSGMNQFSGTGDVWITQTSLYVLDILNYRIQKWLKNGTNPSTIPGNGSFGTGYRIFIDRYDSIYVNDFLYGKVLRFAPNSSVPVTVAGDGIAGNQPNQLYYPFGIYVDDNLTLYIADYNNNRIQMWKYGASVGVTVAGTGVGGSSLAELSLPREIILDINGYMYIADYGNNRIVRWAPNATSGVCIAACRNIAGSDTNKLDGPAGLAFDNEGSLYVSDKSNNRVQKFQILNDESNHYTVP